MNITEIFDDDTYYLSYTIVTFSYIFVLTNETLVPAEYVMMALGLCRKSQGAKWSTMLDNAGGILL